MLKLRELISSLQRGQVLEVRSTDPGVREDLNYPFVKIVRDYCEIGDDDDESRIREKARHK